MATTKGNSDVVVSTPIVNLDGINDFDSALAALQQQGVAVESIAEYGDGFVVLPTADKRTLVGVAFVIVDATFRTDKDTARDYVSLRIMTADGRKLIVNDGSVGIMKQVGELTTRRGSVAGLVVPQGLSGGEYTTEVNGEKVKASTFYFQGI